MRVIYCYIEQEVHSLWALRKYAPKAELVDTSGSIWAYNEAIEKYWNGKEDLVVIEQDKEITHQVLPSFAKCKKPWCSYSSYIYPKAMNVEVAFGLGCVRYSASLQQMVDTSEFICKDDPVWKQCQLCDGKGCWKYLDARIAGAIRKYDVDVHCHGHVKHYHDYGVLGKLCE